MFPAWKAFVLHNIKSTDKCMFKAPNNSIQLWSLLSVIFTKRIPIKQFAATALFACHRSHSKIFPLPLICNSNGGKICRMGQMVHPSLLFPSPSASPFCAYSSATPANKYFQNIYKSQDVSDEPICTFIE